MLAGFAIRAASAMRGSAFGFAIWRGSFGSIPGWIGCCTGPRCAIMFPAKRFIPAFAPPPAATFCM
jgi:hypothetical protein